ncbi:MAG: sterol carrier protein domain-containing protein [Planctomycetaceae bacterium]
MSDPVIAENNGRFVLSVRDGTATVESGGRGDLRCDVRGLAPLYTGMFRPVALAQMGWVTGSATALEAATKVFAGPEPWMPEYF